MQVNQKEILILSRIRKYKLSVQYVSKFSAIRIKFFVVVKTFAIIAYFYYPLKKKLYYPLKKKLHAQGAMLKRQPVFLGVPHAKKWYVNIV